jgi:hypothetical protein
LGGESRLVTLLNFNRRKKIMAITRIDFGAFNSQQIAQLMAAFGSGGKKDSEVETLTNKTIVGGLTGDVTGDITGDVTGNVTGQLISDFATPANSVASTDVILTFTDDIADNEYFNFGDDVFEFILDAGDATQSGALELDIATGSITKEDGAAIFETVFNTSGTMGWTAVDNDDGTVTLSPDVAGVIGNGIACVETNAAHVSTDTALTEAGVNGTVGAKGAVLVDAGFIYIAVVANTIADANWERAAISSF